MFFVNDMQKNDKINNRHRIQVILCLCFVCLTAVLCGGCSLFKEDPMQSAAKYFKEGNYISAESSFLSAIREDAGNAPAWTGYGFSLMKKGDNEGARAVFKRMMDLEGKINNFYGSEPGTAEAVRKGLYEVYIMEGDYKSAVDLLRELGDNAEDKTRSAEYKAEAAALAWKYFNPDNKDAAVTELGGIDIKELVTVITESIDAGNESIKAYRMRANLYYLMKDWDNWEADEKRIIALKDYAFDEYCSMYEVALKYRDGIAALKLIDEIIIYMQGHQAYIDSYDGLIGMMLKGAELAEYNEHEFKPIHYFDQAEEYIKAAENKNLSNNQVLKYSIIIAEKKGKLETAYKLLGVYIEHCPDDRMAIKERNYLKNRVGISD